MAKTMRHAVGAALKIDEVAIPTSGRGGLLRSTMKTLCKHQTTQVSVERSQQTASCPTAIG